jgi:predicted ATP-grasp superfamily ATP-dependent carboligase
VNTESSTSGEQVSTALAPAGGQRPAPGPDGGLDREVPVLIVRQDWNPVHHATVGVIRSFGRAGVAVHAILESSEVPAARSRYLTSLRPWWPGAVTMRQRADHLAEESRRIGGFPVLFAMDDASSILLAEYGDLLARYARLPSVAPGTPSRVADKAELAALCAEASVDHPATHRPRDERQVRTAVADLGLPLIAKWSRPWLLGCTPAPPLRSTTLVTDLGQALALFGRRAEAGSALLLQALIPPTRGGDRFFHGYFTRAADSAQPECRFGAAGRKELAWPRPAGLTARGSWLPDPVVERTAHAAVRAAGFTGLVDLDFRRDPASGRFHLLDFNPRLGAQFRLFTDLDGLDLPRAAHLDLTGREIPPPRPLPGRTLTVEPYDLLGALRPGRHVERAWFARDDPAPFGAAVRHVVTRGLRRLDPREQGSRR